MRQATRIPSNQRIEDYALISDCAPAALVGRNGSIDWLCLPRFDTASCFSALLGEPKHGRWLIAPADPAASVERRYLDGSLILVTRFETAAGTVELVDFIARHHGFSDVVRLVRGLRGRVRMCTEFTCVSITGQSCPGSIGCPKAAYPRLAARSECFCAPRHSFAART
jgi:GH15 family glucan-1,4-alpha-glucosidase